MIDYVLTWMGLNPFGRAKVLSSSFTIIVPSTNNVNEEDNGLQALWVAKVQEKFAELFGGATSTAGTGSWHSNKMGMVHENVMLVTSHMTTAEYRRNASKIKELAEEMKRDMRQEAVALMANERLYLI